MQTLCAGIAGVPTVSCLGTITCSPNSSPPNMQERPSSPQIEVKYLYPSLSLTLILSWDELSSGEHRTSHSPVLPGAPPQTNTIRVSKTLRNSQEWGTKAHNGSPNPLLLTSYKQLWGRLQEGLSAHKQWDGITSPCPVC